MHSERNNQEDAAAGSAQSGAESGAASAGESEAGQDPAPRRKRRRRRRKKKDRPEGEAAGPRGDAKASAAEPAASDPEAQAESGGRASGSPREEGDQPGSDPGWQTLAAGLMSHIDERQIPCRIDGCENTWTWTAQEQMQAFGKPPPRRMCAKHQAALTKVEDREVPCTNPGCGRTWTWTKKAQVAQLQKGGSGQPPRKECPECIKEERELPDREVPCRVEGCARTWTWDREAQLKHRAWARRAAEEIASGKAPRDRGRQGGKRRRRRRQPIDINLPPTRTCGPCRDKQGRITGDREVPCKVHGCTRNAIMDRESQLRAWAKLKTDDLDREGPSARRMCETCRDFCREHPDREVSCGRPGCSKTWTYKTGAQLQDFLAGRRQDPIRLCPDCAKKGLAEVESRTPDGMEVLPCVVPLCDGVWFYREGVTMVAATGWVDLPLDRMCDRCRGERGAEPRRQALAPEPPKAKPEGTPAGDGPGESNSATGDGATEISSDSAVAEESAEVPTPDPPGTDESPATGAAHQAQVAAEPAVVEEAGAANEPAAANEATAANEPTAANTPVAANDASPPSPEDPELTRNE